jgi:hypothetical protein
MRLVVGSLVAVLAVPLLFAAAALAVLSGGASSAPPGGSGGTAAGAARGALAGIPAPMLVLYKKAARTCPGLPWEVLAGIGTVESGNGT